MPPTCRQPGNRPSKVTRSQHVSGVTGPHWGSVAGRLAAAMGHTLLEAWNPHLFLHSSGSQGPKSLLLLPRTSGCWWGCVLPEASTNIRVLAGMGPSGSFRECQGVGGVGSFQKLPRMSGCWRGSVLPEASTNVRVLVGLGPSGSYRGESVSCLFQILEACIAGLRVLRLQSQQRVSLTSVAIINISFWPRGRLAQC